MYPIRIRRFQGVVDLFSGEELSVLQELVVGGILQDIVPEQNNQCWKDDFLGSADLCVGQDMLQLAIRRNHSH